MLIQFVITIDLIRIEILRQTRKNIGIEVNIQPTNYFKEISAYTICVLMTKI